MPKRISRSQASLPPNSRIVPEPQTTTPDIRMSESIQAQLADIAAPPESVEDIWEDVLEGVDDFGDEEALQQMLEGSNTDVKSGAYTPGAETEDLTEEMLIGGKQLGGPTGGDVYGAGEKRPVDEAEFVNEDDTHAVGIDKPISVDRNRPDLAAKIAGENTAALLKGFWPTP